MANNRQRWIELKDIPKSLAPNQAFKWRAKVKDMVSLEIESMRDDLLIELDSVVDNHLDIESIDGTWKETLADWKKDVQTALSQARKLRIKINKAEKAYKIKRK